MRRTKYTCPFLMTLSMWYWRLALGRDYTVKWQVPSDNAYGAYITAQRKDWKHGGYEIRCVFPRWMVMFEYKIRNLCFQLYGRFKLRFLMRTTMLLGLLFLCVGSSFGYFADTDTEHENFAVGIIDDNGNSIISATGIFPLESLNGYVAGYSARQSAGNEVVSQVYVGRIQGGFDAGPLKLRGYVEGSRDLVQLIDLRIESGLFVESPSFTWNSIEFSAAGGNFMDQRNLDDKIGRDADDKTTTFGFLVFGTAEYKRLSTVLRFKPNFQLDDFASEFAVSWNEEVSETVGIQIAGLWKYDTASVADSMLSRSIQILFTYTPN